MGQLSTEEYIEALERLRKSPRDRVGLLGSLGVTAVGATAGAALSGTVAAGAGAATLFGSSTLGSILGGIFVTTTPAGWVAGMAAAGGILGYIISKLVRSGGRSDAKREAYRRELEKLISESKVRDGAGENSDADFAAVVEAVEPLIREDRISQKQSTNLLLAVHEGRVVKEEVLSLLQRIRESQPE